MPVPLAFGEIPLMLIVPEFEAVFVPPTSMLMPARLPEPASDAPVIVIWP